MESNSSPRAAAAVPQAVPAATLKPTPRDGGDVGKQSQIGARVSFLPASPTAEAGAPNLRNVITADASRVSPSEFVSFARSVFAPAPTRVSERAAASSAYIAAIFAAGLEADPTPIRKAYLEKLDEIDRRYGWSAEQ